MNLSRFLSAVTALALANAAHAVNLVPIEHAKAVCRAYETGFFSPATDLAYGHRLNGPRGLAVLEPVEEVRAQRVHGVPRTYGYGSGIEDLAYQNGMLLFALCDAEEATGEAEFARLARRTFRGLMRMSTLTQVPQFRKTER